MRLKIKQYHPLAMTSDLVSKIYIINYTDYLLIPTWIIGCSYSENGSNDDQTDMNSYDGSEQQDLNYQKIFIDAQTGKLHDPKEVGSERYYADVN